jgi:uncharacterized protein YbaR (Trm112 family)
MTSDAERGTDDQALAPELLEIIRCPSCLGEFLPPEPAALVCSSCGLRYPVRNGVPILLLDEAQRSGPSGSTGPGARPAGTD